MFSSADGHVADQGLRSYRTRHSRTTSLAIGAALLCAGRLPADAVEKRLRTLAGALGLGTPSQAAQRVKVVHAPARWPEPTPLHRVAEELAREPVPDLGWTCTLVSGLPNSESLLMWRADHVLVDGAGVAAVLAALCEPACPPDAVTSPAHRQATEATVGNGPPAKTRVPTWPGTARAVRSAASMLVAVPHASRLVPEHILTRTPAPHDTRHAFTHLPLPRLRALATAYGVTVNDIYLAALAGALRAWVAPWTEPDALRAVNALMPVNLRTPADAGVLGNRHLPVRVVLPVAEVRAAARVALVYRRTKGLAAAMRHPIVHKLSASAPDLVGRWGMERCFHPRRATLLASSVTGPPHPLAVAGVPVRRVLPMNFLPAGHQLSVVLARAAGHAAVGFTGTRALPRLHELADLWKREVSVLQEAAELPL